jgi:hypothetical protein
LQHRRSRRRTVSWPALNRLQSFRRTRGHCPSWWQENGDFFFHGWLVGKSSASPRKGGLSPPCFRPRRSP